MSPTQVWHLARREYLARVRSRAFVFMTALIPALLGLYAVIGPLVVRSGPAELRIALVDLRSGFGDALATRLAALEEPRITVPDTTTVAAVDQALSDRLGAAVRDDRLDGYLILGRDDAGLPDARYVSTETTSILLRQQLRTAVRGAAVTALLAGSGIDPDALRRRQQLDVETLTLSETGERAGRSELAFVTTFAVAVLLYMAILINGQGMATAIVEEKSSRLIEVILGAVTATEFMTGKILGVLGAGVTQLAIWLVLAVAVLLQMVPGLLVGSGAGIALHDVLTVELLFFVPLFFVLGYVLYSVLIAVIAVTCTSTEELGHTMFIAVLPLVAALLFAMTATANPTSAVVRWTSLVPFFTPVVMPARINVSTPPAWEVWLGAAIVLATIAAMGGLAGNIFRYALLMTGKRPTLPELVRVVRARP